MASKLSLSKETLRTLESGDLLTPLGGATTTTDVTGACSKPKTCHTNNTCTTAFC